MNKSNENKSNIDVISFFWVIIAIVSFVVLSVAILEESIIAAVVVLTGNVIFLFFLSKERFNLLHFMCITSIIYSLMVIIGVNSESISRMENNAIVGILYLIAQRFAIMSGKIVLLLMAFVSVILSPVIDIIRRAIAKRVYGDLPEINHVGRKNQCAYLRYEYGEKRILLIYRNGRRVKVLDTFEYNFVDTKEQYSLELADDRTLILKAYDVYSHKVLIEKHYNVSL